MSQIDGPPKGNNSKNLSRNEGEINELAPKLSIREQLERVNNPEGFISIMESIRDNQLSTELVDAIIASFNTLQETLNTMGKDEAEKLLPAIMPRFRATSARALGLSYVAPRPSREENLVAAVSVGQENKRDVDTIATTKESEVQEPVSSPEKILEGELHLFHGGEIQGYASVDELYKFITLPQNKEIIAREIDRDAQDEKGIASHSFFVLIGNIHELLLAFTKDEEDTPLLEEDEKGIKDMMRGRLPKVLGIGQAVRATVMRRLALLKEEGPDKTQ